MDNILAVFFPNREPLFSWLLGRQTMARLLCTSRLLSMMIAPMHQQVAILHGISSRQPLGSTQCIIGDASWLFMNLHVSADRGETADGTFVSWCPNCQVTFRNYLYACVRYQYLGKLENATMILSELDAESDSERTYMDIVDDW